MYSGVRNRTVRSYLLVLTISERQEQSQYRFKVSKGKASKGCHLPTRKYSRALGQKLSSLEPNAHPKTGTQEVSLFQAGRGLIRVLSLVSNSTATPQRLLTRLSSSRRAQG